jgi:hypothetical protein
VGTTSSANDDNTLKTRRANIGTSEEVGLQIGSKIRAPSVVPPYRTATMEQRPVAVGYSPAVKFIPFVPVPVPVPVSVLAVALALWSAPSPALAQDGERSVLRQLYGDLAFEVRTKGQGSLTVGVADSRTTLVFTLMATDLRRWSDSAARVLAARAPRRGQTARWEAVVSGPGITAGSMALARTIAPGDTTLVLLVTDTSFRGMRTTLNMQEARALTAAMKRAANASLPTRAAPLPKARPAVPPRKPPIPPEPR